MLIDENMPLRHYVQMSQRDALDHCTGDVISDLHDGTWRWTLQRPSLRFRLPKTQDLKFRVQLTVPEVTFEQTGPVKISIAIEDHPLETLSIEKPGETIFEKPVPPEWLTTKRPVQVQFEIDKLWVSPGDGVKRGFILTGAGFVE